MANLEWSPIVRNYDNEHKVSSLESIYSPIHPLLPSKPKQVNLPKPPVVSKRGSVSITTTTFDPLSDPLNGGNSSNDPLSNPLSNLSINDPLSSSKIIEKNISLKDAQETHSWKLNTPWYQRKQQILKDYVFVGTLTVSNSAISGFEGSGVEDGSGKKEIDKYSHRLASLERRHVHDSNIQMSQTEYIQHINKLTSDLKIAWNNDERVQSLKIAIMLSKLLSDTNIPQFYPSLFVLVTDELDKFGEMVFNRLKKKAEEVLNEGNKSNKLIKLPHDFTSNDIPNTAKETCRNWFYKIACIRELLPRVYVEMALLKCYRFLSDNDYPQILSRLGSIARGLGDPLVSLYARTYLGKYVPITI